MIWSNSKYFVKEKTKYLLRFFIKAVLTKVYANMKPTLLLFEPK